MHGVRAFGAGIGEWGEQFLFGLFDLCIVEGWSGDALGMVSGGESGAPAEDQQIGERVAAKAIRTVQTGGDRKSTRLNSSHLVISYAVFCLKKKKKVIRET